MRFFILFFFLLTLSCNLFSQCFSSPGNPIGGTANMGILDKYTLRTISFFRHSYSDSYNIGSKKFNGKQLVNCAYYNYIGEIIGYGLFEKLSIETELGYFINKTQKYTINDSVSDFVRGNGLSNIVVSGKFNVFKNDDKRFNLSASCGLKIPLSLHSQLVNGVENIEVQPSTGSYGIVLQTFLVKEKPFQALRFFLINRYETNFTNKSDYYISGREYKFGDALYTSVYISKHLHFRYAWLTENWTAILQIRNELKEKNMLNDKWINASGSCIVLVSPQLNYTIKEKWNVSVIVDIPVYQYYYEMQLATKYAFTINITRDFLLNKKKL